MDRAEANRATFLLRDAGWGPVEETFFHYPNRHPDGWVVTANGLRFSRLDQVEEFLQDNSRTER
jgi:hypothetical protein